MRVVSRTPQSDKIGGEQRRLAAHTGPARRLCASSASRFRHEPGRRRPPSSSAHRTRLNAPALGACRTLARPQDGAMPQYPAKRKFARECALAFMC